VDPDLAGAVPADRPGAFAGGLVVAWLAARAVALVAALPPDAGAGIAVSFATFRTTFDDPRTDGRRDHQDHE
jgi:hypothetical protein